MKLEKAIEILIRYQKDYLVRTEEDFDDAIKLGVEALKRVQNRRNKKNWFGFDALPGETE